MRKFKIIGLTGPTGSGKTALANYFAEKGFRLINADDVARGQTAPGMPCVKALTSVFGDSIIDEDGALVRKRLAALAFSDKDKTLLLNQITHPFVYLKVFELIREYSAQGEEKILFDAPQLLESNGDVLCDSVIAVLCPKDVRAERIIRRDGITRQQAYLRINAQKDDAFYKDRADFVIDNLGDLDSLYKKADAVLRQIL